MRKARSTLFLLLLTAVVIQVLWWTVEPLIPYIIAGLVLVTIGGIFYHRVTRWWS